MEGAVFFSSYIYPAREGQVILNYFTMNKLLLLFLLFISCACKKREEASPNLPACLKTLVADK